MSTININKDDRDRALEVLLYTREEKSKEKEGPVSYKFDLKKIFSLFQREMIFQVKFVVKKKNRLSGGKKC